MLNKINFSVILIIKFLIFNFQIINGQHCSIVINNDDDLNSCGNSPKAKQTSSSILSELKDIELKVFTVNTEDNDGYRRFIRSAKNYGIEIHNIGQDTIWELESSRPSKIRLLRELLQPFRYNENTIILFTDSYTTTFASGPDELIKKFLFTKANVLFGTDNYNYVGHKLSRFYTEDEIIDEKILSGKMFMGFAPHIYKILDDFDFENTDDDEMYFTRIYLNDNLRNEYGIQIDIESKIFQSLDGDIQNMKLKVDNETLEGHLRNMKYMTTPSLIHGGPFSTISFNSFANYLDGSFKNGKCVICEENLVSYKENNLPIVSLNVFVEKAVPFFEEFLDEIKSIGYPKDRIHLFIHSNFFYHENNVKEFVRNYGHQYKSAKLVTTCDELDEIEARKLSVEEAIQINSDFIFSIDADVHIDDPSVLLDLLRHNRTFISPVLRVKNCNQSNFWGAVSANGYYAKSHDYTHIIDGTRRGMWNVPYVSMCYLIHKSVFPKMNFDHMKYDSDIALSESLREEGIFMYVTNIKNYGHLVDTEDFDTTLTRPEFYQLIPNQVDWEKRYIHPKFYDQIKPNYTHKQPCPDVFWFPVTTERFCKDLIAIMETFGKWSDGTNIDPRIEGGYEAVPTRDIHMNQVGLQEMWIRFLREFVKPLRQAVYDDNDDNDPYTDANFVVRYRPDEQASLRPHHDTSTYTINIALNRAGIDFQGGGCRFVRYNCSVRDTRLGWMLMHPGKLTHLHEGLTVTNGTRYIMVSFVDP